MADHQFFTEKYRNLVSFDLRAELLYDALLRNNFSDDEIVFRNNGVFFRKYSKDVMSISSDAQDSDVLNIDTSRDGFYHILPESITHNYRSNDYNNDPVTEFKLRKKEEKEARHFYSPLENELFRMRHAIERHESDFFSKASTTGLADIIKMILGLPDTIPDVLAVKMFYALMRQKGKVDQGIEGIKTILEKILHEKISYTTKNIQLENGHDTQNKSDEMIMGINTTLQSSQEIFLKKYRFSIGPLKNPHDLPNYFDQQTLESFLHAFFNLFLPFQVQYAFEIKLNAEDEIFSMDDDTIYKSRLGISTVI